MHEDLKGAKGSTMVTSGKRFPGREKSEYRSFEATICNAYFM